MTGAPSFKPIYFPRRSISWCASCCCCRGISRFTMLEYDEVLPTAPGHRRYIHNLSHTPLPPVLCAISESGLYYIRLRYCLGEGRGKVDQRLADVVRYRIGRKEAHTLAVHIVEAFLAPPPPPPPPSDFPTEAGSAEERSTGGAPTAASGEESFPMEVDANNNGSHRRPD